MLQTLYFLILKKANPEKSIVGTLGIHQYKGPYSQGSFALYHATYMSFIHGSTVLASMGEKEKETYLGGAYASLT